MTVPAGPLIAVTAVDHPTLDDWVQGQAQARADEDGVRLGQYLGREDVLEVVPEGTCCHLFAVGDDET